VGSLMMGHDSWPSPQADMENLPFLSSGLVLVPIKASTCRGRV